MKPLSHRGQVMFGVLVTLIMTVLSLVVVGLLGEAIGAGNGLLSPQNCAAPRLPGSVVNVSLTNMGGPLMGQHNGMMSGGAMRLTADRVTVPGGKVSFLVTNEGTISHEMVVLPLPDDQVVGTRPIGGDGKVNEAGSVGEASNTCAAGAGQGILPGTSSWVTLTLTPGRYELLCNLPGHYAAGMYAQLTVS